MAALAACGTSANDASGDGAAASDVTPQCSIFGPGCGKGMTCCFSGTTGTCKELSGCASSVQFECGSPAGCSPGQMCCATIPPISAIDASAASPESGLAPLLAGVTATSFCATTCSLPSVPTCRTGADCAGGAACAQLPEGNLVLAAVGAETIGVCAINGAPPFEGGASEGGGSDGPVSDATGGD